MPSYSEVKTEAVRLVDLFAKDDEVVAGYGKPKTKPKYSAETKLPTLGMNAYVRKAMVKSVDRQMRAKFGSAWRAVGQGELKDADTIGKFVNLMCACTSVAVPHGEPS